jgi:hypothetical protein
MMVHQIARKEKQPPSAPTFGIPSLERYVRTSRLIVHPKIVVVAGAAFAGIYKKSVNSSRRSMLKGAGLA